MERITDAQKLSNIQNEWDALQNAVKIIAGLANPKEEFHQAVKALRATNEALWDVEDALRLNEKTKDFGDAFIALAREVYVLNDQRAALKSSINILTGSNLREEKSYEGY